MLCEAIENRILDYQENNLAPVQREEVEAHLAGCADCRRFAAELQLLDAALAADIKVPELTANFGERLHERIAPQPSAWSEARRAERRRQLEAEYEIGEAQLLRGAFSLASLLNQLALAALVTVGGLLAWFLTSQWATHPQAQTSGGLPANLLPLAAVSLVFIIAGLAEMFPRRFRLLEF